MPPLIDITGQRFGQLTVVRRDGRNKFGHVKWLCSCDCGGEAIVAGQELKRGKTTGCPGCKKDRLAKNRFVDLTGKQIGEWMVLGRAENRGSTTYWRCQCSCSTVKDVAAPNLTRHAIGKSRSCGCYRSQVLADIKKIDYGLATKRAACGKYKNSAQKRGIPFELSFEQCMELFTSDCWYCGAPPSNKVVSKSGNGDFVYSGIDRIDNTKGYTTDNVVPCCTQCNYMKKAQPYDDFVAWILRAADHIKSRRRKSASGE